MAGGGAGRSTPTPLRRGVAAVVAVAVSAFSLVGAAAPNPVPTVAGTPSGAMVVTAAQTVPVEADAVPVRSSVAPVTLEPDVVDAADLVKAVQLTEQESTRLAAERTAADERAVLATRAAAAAQSKAAQEKAAQERIARQQADAVRPSAAGGSDCGLDTSGLGAVRPHVRTAAEFLGCLFGRPAMYGVASRAGASDHPSGKALDLVVDRTTGDALAACALRNQEALGITYVIWRQRINHGGGWTPMADRGGVTANHFDHVHISFASGAGSRRPTAC